MSQETKNKNEQPKDEAVSEQVPEKELPVEEPKQNAGNPQEAKAEEAKKEEKPSELDAVKEQLAKEHDGYLRLAAEYDNFRKRSQKEKDDLYTRSSRPRRSASSFRSMTISSVRSRRKLPMRRTKRAWK